MADLIPGTLAPPGVRKNVEDVDASVPDSAFALHGQGVAARLAPRYIDYAAMRKHQHILPGVFASVAFERAGNALCEGAERLALVDGLVGRAQVDALRHRAFSKCRPIHALVNAIVAFTQAG